MPGARPAALGGAFAAVADDTNALHYNPAGISNISTLQASFTHTNLFSLSDLRYDQTAVVIPINKKIGIGASYSQFGPDIYRETESILGVGFKPVDKISFGISVTRMDLNIKNYGSAHDWTGSVGFLGEINDMVWIGMTGRNIYSTHIGNTNEMPEKSLFFGLRVMPRDFLSIILETGREINAEQITYRIGQEVSLIDMFIMRFGFHNYPDRISGGFGFLIHNMRLDYAVITHQYLNIQHQFSLLISW